MSGNNWLFLFIIGLLGLTGWMIATAPVVPDHEHEEEDDDDEEDWW